MARCQVCRAVLAGGNIYFHFSSDGLFCPLHRRGNSGQLSADSHSLALGILRAPISAFVQEPWPRKRAADLRRFLIQSLERHLERKLTTADVLVRLGG
jgi:DNA repair protein RecO (recombination protein O)